jgi:hypothetical protein|tara:strand:+ start:778 stop:1650 length:873 start_codon:yes stop_codon:yes gene_type:complete
MAAYLLIIFWIYEEVKLVMKRVTEIISNISRITILFLVITLFLMVPGLAQEEEEFFEEEFDEEFMDDEEFFDDEEFLDEEDTFLEGDEFGEDDFFEDEGDIEFGGELEEESEEEDFGEEDNSSGITVQIVGALPGLPGNTSGGTSVFYPTYKNSSLAKWISPTPFFRISIDFPNYLELGSVGFRTGVDIGMASFESDPDVLPIDGKFGGITAFGVVTTTFGVTNLKLGVGIVGSSPAYMASQSFGFALGPSLDLRLGVRATTAYGPPEEIKREGTHASWVDAFVAFGITF